MHRLLAATRSRLGNHRRILAGPLAVVAAGLVAFGFFAGFAGTSSATQPIVTRNAKVLEQGQALFNTHCSSCHGVGGVGTSRAPSLIHVGAAAADFYLITGRMPLNSKGEQALQHTPFFNAKEIEALVSYVADLPHTGYRPNPAASKWNSPPHLGPRIPNILPLCPNGKQSGTSGGANANCVTLSYGQQTYALNCAQCHQIAGSGGILANGMIVPSLKAAPPLVVAEAIRVGPQPMPRFGTGQISEKQLSALVHYVQYLHSPEDHGGFSISGFGPVAEGFVGILVGLGLLLFVARMIGTRG